MRKCLKSGVLVLPALAAAVLLAHAAFAEYDLGDLKPLDIYDTSTPSEWSRTNAASLWLSSGAFVATNEAARPVSLDNNGNVAFSLETVQYGMLVSQQKPDFSLGDWCTYLPTENPADIDWAKTGDEILKSQDYKEGRLLYNASATNDLERVMFTRGGATTVKWYLRSRVGDESVDRTYIVASTAATRPYRIFWTEDGFDGPAVSLVGSNGQSYRHVRLFGDPAIVATNVPVSVQQSMTNLVSGVVVDTDSHTIRAFAKHDSDPDRGEHQGPRGQFILAYYDTDSFSRLIYAIVVEVDEPDVAERVVEVGDRVEPTGVGYSTDSLSAFIVSGDSDDPGDVNSPYLYKHAGFTDFSPKTGCVFAIAPNDAANMASGKDSAHKADIYWQSTDPMGTFWPFEHDQYLIRWGEDLPKVVTGGEGTPGCGILLPSKFDGATSVEHFSTPARIATVSSNSVVVTGAGKFLLKILVDDNVWFQPFESLLNTDTNWYDRVPGEWHVGMELTPRGDAAAGRGAAIADAIDSTLPGYIYAEGSYAKNWNPRLYHAPRAKTAAEESMGGTQSADNVDPYASLKSAIYAVRAAEEPIEVWWFRSLRQDDMPAELMFPTAAQLYRAIWPLPEETHSIVLASQLGSAGESLASTGQALYLDSTNSMALAHGLTLGGEDTGWTVGFWINPSSRAGGYEPVTPGRVLTITNAAGCVTVAANSATGLNIDGAILDVPTNAWTHIALVATTNGTMEIYRNGMAALSRAFAVPGFATNGTMLVLGACAFDDLNDIAQPAATGIGIDHLAAWPFALAASDDAAYVAGGSNDATKRLRYSWTFDSDDDLKHIGGVDFRVAFDDAGGMALIAIECLALGPGGPAKSSGTFKAVDGIEPRIYYENNISAIGYNPNEEHAFMRGGVAYALRCDLNTAESSEPFVLVEYNSGGKGAMKAFDIQLTNEVYSSFASDVTVGNLLAGPHPLDYIDGYYNTKNFCVEESEGADSYVVYRDRHNRMWARRDGTTWQFNHYPVLEGFWFPTLEEQPATGTLVGWLSCLDITSPTRDNILNGAPEPWKWRAVWPADDKIPTMRIGQTLTTADSGLPEVWNALSMAVVYPVPRDDGTNRADTVVTLIDPTVAQTAPLAIERNFADEYGFTVGPAGSCQLKSGKYYFAGLPPNISDRFYIDTNAAEAKRMTLIGQMVSKKAGTSYLQVNTLSAAERQALKDICKAPGAVKARWDAGVEALAPREVQPSPRRIENVALVVDTTDDGLVNAVTPRVRVDYAPKDHYALVANGCGTNYVTLIENDFPDETVVPAGSTISMHVIKVVPELYAGPLVVLADPNNKLSEQLNILYASPLGDSSDNYTFEWRRREPAADGVVPAAGEQGWSVKTNGVGATTILLGGGGANLTELVNTYYEMRYKPIPGTDPYRTLGDVWSGWCGPTLAEGWVQRVLNTITPFAQRMSDFYANATEINYTMPEQIGGPYRGDVALNDANLNSVGLVELYQTVLNKAESLSLALGINDPNANKQLMEAASRLADLYMLLGDDAYSDAVNPTIETSSTDSRISDYATFPASTYCFANQVPSLLDEELALLRGRTKAVAPNMTTYPYYNRLMWNFTKGITQGEMAYVQNYGIAGSGGEITPEQAAAHYPMGHGDAYGHYLSAVWGYYRLLRNPNFEWGDPSMMEMLVADSIVNMDYEDEQKFAMAAAKMAQAGADVVDLTARKTWRDQGGVAGAGYFDANEEQGFGYGEWAVRTGLGALYNWATVNSIVPTEANADTNRFADVSIKDITRETIPALRLLAENFAAVDAKVNRLDAGLNPLGLSDNAIPFDIDPVRVESGAASHFEQILERAERALDNAKTVLDYADRFGARLRQIEEAEASDADSLEESEAAFKKDLIAVYGTPYPDDIGPSGTYVQGYDGPDLYHYNYIDVSQYGIEEFRTSLSTTITVYAELDADWLNTKPGADFDYNIPITYNVAAGGIIVKPGEWKDLRVTEGSIQAAYREFIEAYVRVQQKIKLYQNELDHQHLLDQYLPQKWDNANITWHLQQAINAAKILNEGVKAVTQIVIDVAETAESTSKIVTDNGSETIPWFVAGMAVGGNPAQAVAEAVMGSIHLGIKTSADTVTRYAKITQQVADSIVNVMASAFDVEAAAQDRYNTKAEIRESLCASMGAIEAAAFEIQNAYAALAAAEASYRAEVEKGQQLLAKREMMRKHQSNTATARRYQDMYYRVQRNTALSKFNTSFDVAQHYVWQLAKVYDYETGLLSSDRQAGDAFLREIVATRALGEKGVSVVAEGTDGGLWDIVSRMKGNWEVLKGRLGVNNQDASTKWFSLRYSLFRINPGSKGDAAWRQELAKYAVDDIFADSEVLRYCQKTQGAAVPLKEPGLIIPFSTSINSAENFFGKPLLGGETTYSSSYYAVKINSVGVSFAGYDALTVQSSEGLSVEPDIYLVPVGSDYMRTPSGTSRETLAFNVVDQVLPLPYAVGSTELDDTDWLATFSGLDGTVDSMATIRRHSTMRVGAETTSSRLVGRSVWNDRWLLVIPASSLSSDRVNALKTFINGLDTDKDGHIDIPGINDIKIGIRAYSRQGN